MRPAVKFLNQVLIEKIITEARTILTSLGVEVQNKQVVDLLNDRFFLSNGLQSRQHDENTHESKH